MKGGRNKGREEGTNEGRKEQMKGGREKGRREGRSFKRCTFIHKHSIILLHKVHNMDLLPLVEEGGLIPWTLSKTVQGIRRQIWNNIKKKH